MNTESDYCTTITKHNFLQLVTQGIEFKSIKKSRSWSRELVQIQQVLNTTYQHSMDSIPRLDYLKFHVSVSEHKRLLTKRYYQ